jgi:hypothetical protein
MSLGRVQCFCFLFCFHGPSVASQEPNNQAETSSATVQKDAVPLASDAFLAEPVAADEAIPEQERISANTESAFLEAECERTVEIRTPDKVSGVEPILASSMPVVAIVYGTSLIFKITGHQNHGFRCQKTPKTIEQTTEVLKHPISRIYQKS